MTDVRPLRVCLLFGNCTVRVSFHLQDCKGRKFGLISKSLENWLFFCTERVQSFKNFPLKGVDFSFISLHCKGRILGRTYDRSLVEFFSTRLHNRNNSMM